MNIDYNKYLGKHFRFYQEYQKMGAMEQSAWSLLESENVLFSAVFMRAGPQELGKAVR